MWRLDEKAKRKYAAAERFGLTETLMQTGWAGLSAKDSGRIGGSLKAKREKVTGQECCFPPHQSPDGDSFPSRGSHRQRHPAKPSP
ncbi:MAG: hypothetical protein IJX84_07285 [Clostridia bacterium]|nr:hypothetical protein [Clostridia bacterium]